MRISMVVTSAIFLAGTLSAHAQVSKADCEAMKRPMNLVSENMRLLQKTLEGQSEAAALAKFVGSDRDAYLALQAARLELVDAMEAYAVAAEDVAYAMTICAR